MDYNTGGMPDMLGGPGMQITGKWYNKRTGQTISVRDSYFDSDGLQVMTSHGNMISGEEFARDYIQCDDTVYDQNGNPTTEHEEVDYESMFGGHLSTSITPESAKFVPETELTQRLQPQTMKTESPALAKLFSKLEDFPRLDVNVIWDNIPISELKMLKNIFDISNEEIAEYIYDNYCTDVEIKKAISDAIQRMI
jgi:hypothetical protein